MDYCENVFNVLRSAREAIDSTSLTEVYEGVNEATETLGSNITSSPVLVIAITAVLAYGLHLYTSRHNYNTQGQNHTSSSEAAKNSRNHDAQYRSDDDDNSVS